MYGYNPNELITKMSFLKSKEYNVLIATDSEQFFFQAYYYIYKVFYVKKNMNFNTKCLINSQNLTTFIPYNLLRNF